MGKAQRRQIMLTLTVDEFAALQANAERHGTAPTTMAMCHVLAGLQDALRGGHSLLTEAAGATYVLKDAADRLREHLDVAAADQVEDAAISLSRACNDQLTENANRIAPGHRLKQMRHVLQWHGPDAGLPRQIPPVVKVECLSETTTRETFVRESDEEIALRQKIARELEAADE